MKFLSVVEFELKYKTFWIWFFWSTFLSRFFVLLWFRKHLGVNGTLQLSDFHTFKREMPNISRKRRSHHLVLRIKFRWKTDALSKGSTTSCKQIRAKMYTKMKLGKTFCAKCAICAVRRRRIMVLRTKVHNISYIA